MKSKNYMYKIVIIKGSVRPKNNTTKAVRIVENELYNSGKAEVHIVDPGDFNLPLPGLDTNITTVRDLKRIVSDATGIILVTPEYHGSFSSVIKLVIDNLGFPSALKGKPVSLLGVASGRIGAIKALEGLRSVCSHVGALVLPGSVSIAQIHTWFDENGKCTDPLVEKQIRSTAVNLLDYIVDHICPKMNLEEMVRAGAA